MIEILSPTEVARGRVTGALVGEILQTVKARSTAGTNLLEIDAWTRAMIEDAGAESCYVDYEPSFGRGPFGHYICTSVNDAVLHGLPHDYALADGDVLTLDLAVLKEGSRPTRRSRSSSVAPRSSHRVAPSSPPPSGRWRRGSRRPARAPGSATSLTPSARCSRRRATRSTPSSVGTASARRCTRTRTSPTPAGRVVASRCVRD